MKPSLPLVEQENKTVHDHQRDSGDNKASHKSNEAKSKFEDGPVANIKRHYEDSQHLSKV